MTYTRMITFVALLLSVLLTAATSDALDHASVPLKCFPLPDVLAESPAALGMQMVDTSNKLTTALNSQYRPTQALGYWREIGCLCRALCHGNETKFQQFQTFKLRQIVRDSFKGQVTRLEIPLNFLKGVGNPEGYGYLLEEINDPVESPFVRSIYTFAIALFMQHDLSVTPEIRNKVLPNAVNLVVSSSEEPLYLQNEATGKYLDSNGNNLSASNDTKMAWKFILDGMWRNVDSSPTVFRLHASTNDALVTITIPVENYGRYNSYRGIDDVGENNYGRHPVIDDGGETETITRTIHRFVVIPTEDNKVQIKTRYRNSICLSENDQGEIDLVDQRFKREQKCTTWVLTKAESRIQSTTEKMT